MIKQEHLNTSLDCLMVKVIFASLRSQKRTTLGTTSQPGQECVIAQQQKPFMKNLVGVQIGKGNENPKHRPTFCWSVANKNAAIFLDGVLPHLIIKREEAEVALSLQTNINAVKYPHKEQQEKVREYREELYQKCRALKHISYPPLEKKHLGGQRGRPPKVKVEKK